MRCVRLVVLALVAAAPALAVKAKKCPDGSFVIDGPELVPAGDVASRFDAITVEGRKVSIASGCEAVRAKRVRTRKGTKLTARWRTCGELSRVRLRVRIDKDCLQLAGKLKAKGVGEKTFSGLFDPKPPPELYEGAPVTEDIGCDTLTVLDAVEKLCELAGASPCVSQTASCRRYRRQLFTGTRLQNAPTIPGQWNGRGGSGDLMADAVLCSLRELSPELGGPLVSEATVGLGPLGDIHVRQEVGFTKFDRLRERFEGYRRVEVDMPVVGKAQAITQPLVFDAVGFTGGGFSAGNYPIQHAFALDVATEDKTKIIQFTPPGFVVGTPFGPVTVTPEFTYGTRTAVVVTPYAGSNAAHDVTSLYLDAGATWHMRLLDLYGVGPGLVNTATETGPATYPSQRGGWSSQLGLGTRGAVLGQAPWSPPGSGPLTRPDTDLFAPRSTDEATPSVYASAMAELAWPSHPSQILPDWVFTIPFLDPPIARLTVAPSIAAGVPSQLFVAVDEGADHIVSGEFAFTSRRLSTMTMRAQVGAFGLFQVEAGVRILVTADFPFPVGSKTFVDIEKKIPIPLFGTPASGHLDIAFAFSGSSQGPTFPEPLDYLGSFKAFHTEPAAITSFIEQCFAPQALAEQPVPQPEPEPGDPATLFEGALWPCNICIFTAGHPTLDLGTIRAQYEAALPSHPDWPPWPEEIPDDWVAILAPATTPPAWGCDTNGNTGCYDLCAFDFETNTLTVVLGPEEVIPLLPPTPDYDDERAVLAQCDFEPPR
jgi:hypothetical protein